MTWIQTSTGRKFDLLNPLPADVDFYDIAHALSKICRFQGHCTRFYSVAQHCVHVAELVDEPYRLDALLHDAGEAYYGDITRPQKIVYRDMTNRITRLGTFNEFDAFTHRIDAVIAAALNLSVPLPECVTVADDTMLATEARDLMGPHPEPWVSLPDPHPMQIVPWTPTHAFQEFVTVYEELTKEARHDKEA